MQPNYTPVRLPETMTPHDIGVEMARLRTQFNLTQQEVSDRLHIRPRYINAVEEGRFDLMPGKVYARGYLHTYAEFLGLDAEQVVSLCFALDGTVAAATVHRPLPSVRPEYNLNASHWRSYGILGVGLLVVMLLIGQIFGAAQDPVTAPAPVAPVPEAMLQSLRTLVMPTADNFECLTHDAMLTCFYTDDVSLKLARMLPVAPKITGDIDVSGLAVAVPVATADVTKSALVSPGAGTPQPAPVQPVTSSR